jgi:hypothetical protein
VGSSGNARPGEFEVLWLALALDVIAGKLCVQSDMLARFLRAWSGTLWEIFHTPALMHAGFHLTLTAVLNPPDTARCWCAAATCLPGQDCTKTFSGLWENELQKARTGIFADERSKSLNAPFCPNNSGLSIDHEKGVRIWYDAGQSFPCQFVKGCLQQWKWESWWKGKRLHLYFIQMKITSWLFTLK